MSQSLRVGINLTTIETLPIYLAAQEPECRNITLAGGKLPALVAREVDVATHAESQALGFSVANPDIRVLLTVAECSYRIVGRRSAGIANAADLRGKRIATIAYTSAHYYLAKVLRSVDVSEDEVQVVDMTIEDMSAALLRGELDAISIWEPCANDAAEALGSDAVLFQDAALYRERLNLNALAETLDDPHKRAAIVEFVRHIMRMAKHCHSHSADVKPLIASKLGLTQTKVANVWDQFTFPGCIPVDLIDVMTEEEQWLARSQGRAARPHHVIAGLVDTSVWQDAVAMTAPAL
jgi:NitT/TauT family transport system substrate-binding protein